MSLSNYDIVYACSELFSIYIIYYFFQSLFGTQIRNKVITIIFCIDNWDSFRCKHSFFESDFHDNLTFFYLIML